MKNNRKIFMKTIKNSIIRSGIRTYNFLEARLELYLEVKKENRKARSLLRSAKVPIINGPPLLKILW